MHFNKCGTSGDKLYPYLAATMKDGIYFSGKHNHPQTKPLMDGRPRYYYLTLI
jgi:hypothetical protein